jgi:hypothetical protein
MPWSVVPVKGVQPNSHRGIAFLVCAEQQQVNGEAIYRKLKEKNKRNVLSRFDYWLAGNTCDKYFHGWPNLADYKECFVFKWKQAGANHRLYGFLCHPKPSAMSFQTCILVLHSQKTDQTDFSYLAYINKLRTLPEVIRAVEKAFPE